MATLPNLMALYGALDPAESPTDDPVISEIAARYLPTTEGRGGWYGSIVNLFGTRGEETFPGLEEALENLTSRSEDSDDKLTIPEQSRMVYVIGALIHQPEYARRFAAPEGLFARTLALAAPDDPQTPADVGFLLQQHLFENFNSAGDWIQAINSAVGLGLVKSSVAGVAPCKASIQIINGYRCAVIDTVSIRKDVELAKLKDVIDPQNWDENAPHLFCSMNKQNPAEENSWGRVLETVSLDCKKGYYKLRTPLRYYNTDLSAQKAMVVYELDHGPDAGDGLVKVDQGFIKMEGLSPTVGVRVRTKKIVHIEPLIPDAQVIFVCGAGYAAMADEMMFGRATGPTPAGAVKWKPSQPPTSGANMSGSGTGSTAPAQPGLSEITFDMWDKCVKKMSTKNSALVSKWLSGKLKADDLIAYTQDVGADVASAPWQLFKKLSEVPVSGTATASTTSNPPTSVPFVTGDDGNST